MRLGGYVFYNGRNPEEYALAHVKKGFGAAVCPDWITLDNPALLQDFKKAMKKHDVKIAEVGAWCNPMHPDKQEAENIADYLCSVNRERQLIENIIFEQAVEQLESTTDFEKITGNIKTYLILIAKIQERELVMKEERKIPEVMS